MTLKKQLLGATLTLTIAGVYTTTWASPGHLPAWSYTAPSGPENWGDLHGEYALCSSGKVQSPIDINDATVTALAPLVFAYQPSAATVLNNGHTIQLSPTDSGSLTLASGNYSFVQMHFHTPSEESIQGRTYPMDAHLVHRNAAGELAVVALLFEEGAHNPALEVILAAMPTVAGDVVNLESIDIAAFLPASHHYYAYMGSLTTPPCAEGVRWQVLSSVVQLSSAQLRAFQALYPMNARPVQPLNGRSVHVGS
ncbi:carbonic anhydrase family protein [Pseudomonas sp. V88_4]|uniref:carbonic anhydrase n=1 Tax=Pseudomonas TaxID=286 RepID=UPI001F3ED1A6|nr:MULTISPECIES: carbonic anhydrase family protein [Pseudomonas]MDI3401148.1 carbonic anhydrase family protein [Pseudomonas sp. V88_4]